MSIELQNGSKFVTALSILEIYNKELYKELGYSNLYDYTSDVFGMGKTNTSLVSSDKSSLTDSSTELLSSKKFIAFLNLSLISLTDNVQG